RDQCHGQSGDWLCCGGGRHHHGISIRICSKTGEKGMTAQGNNNILQKPISTKENQTMRYLRNLLLVLLAGLIALASATASADSAKKLNVFIWSQYMDPAIIKQFEEEN